MAKKKIERNSVKTLTVNPSALDKYDNKYLGVIKEYVQDENNLDEMMGAIAVINAQLMPLLMKDKIPKKIRDDIIKTWEYADSKMMTSKKNERRILENWGGTMPLLFRVGAVLNYEKNKERIDFEYTLLDDDKKLLFERILKSTWNIREKRRLVCGTLSLSIPRTIPHDSIEQYNYFVKDIINTFLLAEEDVLIFALERPEGDIISALMNKNGNIRIVPPDALRWSYSKDAMTGEEIGNPEGEQYVEFDICI